eukprot:TRINITY_DN56825_c0_g1_i1.p1 TRINITY_DN56825_c0_g1~~TRINITY_DN56825_c0_g1_i1.p1  ORF type:complete len:322 (-),score=98.82 TRINITY_DN56825_c0_g1_i1:191-1084(-)
MSRQRALALLGLLGLGAFWSASGSVTDLEEGEDAGAEGEESEDAELYDHLTDEQAARAHLLFDADRDGLATREEVQAHAKRTTMALAEKHAGLALGEVDSNSDGKVSLSEINADADKWNEEVGTPEEELEATRSRRGLEQRKFEAADLDKDGVLTGKEFNEFYNPHVADHVLRVVTEQSLREKDLDRDGSLSPKEFFSSGEVDGQELEMEEEEKELFNSLDQNKDGFISLEELMPWESGAFDISRVIGELFELADGDGDGKLSALELAEVRPQLANTDVLYHLTDWAEHGRRSEGEL